MPYAGPVSPLPSPARSTMSSTRYLAPTFVDDTFSGPSTATGPMPGIPRRTSSNSSGSSTPRRGASPSMSRQSSATRPFVPSRPMDGLPRRFSGSSTATVVTGLPSPPHTSSLGLKLHPSPTKAPHMHRGIKDSMSSTSTVESSLPPTPSDEPHPLPISILSPSKEHGTIPFPTFEPSLKQHHHHSHSYSKTTSHTHLPPPRTGPAPRPNLSARRGSGGHQRPLTGSLHSLENVKAASPQGEIIRPRPTRPTNSMIRKKSGEVVKSSLKQRSQSTPDLTRQDDRADSASDEAEGRPFGEERSKSVRFAGEDEDKGVLESVVVFMREQKVTAVSQAIDPNNPDTETEQDTDASDFVEFRTRKNAAARAVDEAGNIQMEGGSTVPRIRTDFGPDARGLLKEEKIILERAELQSGPGPLMLRGTAIARNVAFQKWVAVRFTLDRWHTVSEVSANHVCHIPSSTTGDEGWDRFSFAIKLDDYRRKIVERQLLMCVRFSVDGQEWWDSNNGLNYNFTFKKATPRRQSRMSAPAHYVLSEDADLESLPGVRYRPGGNAMQGRSFSSAKSSGPRDWVFPRLSGDLPLRADSPMQSPPPAATFRPPALPDVHAHLSLSKYCAPSPPQSPPREHPPSSIPLVLSSESAEPGMSEMQVVGGHLATSLAPGLIAHERRSSWNGDGTTWDSFAQVMTESDQESVTDGDATPVAPGSRSPMVRGESSESSPEKSQPMTLKRSTNDLRSLVDADGLLTPPSSNVSSPPSPASSLPALPAINGVPPMSPSPSSSATSTGESSPINPASNDSTPDITKMPITIEPSPTDKLFQNADDYNRMLDAFCFFKSKRQLNEPEYYRVQRHVSSGHASGHSSPGEGFPFPSRSSNDTPTQASYSSSEKFEYSMTSPPNQRTPRASPSQYAAGAATSGMNQFTLGYVPSVGEYQYGG